MLRDRCSRLRRWSSLSRDDGRRFPMVSVSSKGFEVINARTLSNAAPHDALESISANVPGL